MFRMQKQGFLDYKNVILTQWENVDFSKEVNPWFSPQNFEVLLPLIFFEKDLDMVFNDVLNGKKDFLDYKSVILK